MSTITTDCGGSSDAVAKEGGGIFFYAPPIRYLTPNPLFCNARQFLKIRNLDVCSIFEYSILNRYG